MRSNKTMITEQQLHKVIRESIKRIIKEALSQSVYHFTSISSLFNILSNNEMYCQSAKAGEGADDYSSKYDFYISMTRAKSSQEGFGYSVSRGPIARIEFDGDKLNNNFHGGPINYWGGGEGLINKFSYMRKAMSDKNFEYKEITDPKEIENNRFDLLEPFDYIRSNGTSSAREDSPQYVKDNGKYYKKVQTISPEIQHHRYNEIEDRLFTNKPVIENIISYIKRVDVFVNGNEELSDTLLATLTRLSLRFSSIVFIYDNLKDFDTQSENTVNEKYKNMYDRFGNLIPLSSKRVDIGFIADVCNLSTFFDDSNVKNQKKAKLLKKYGLDKYTSEVIKKSNSFWGLQGLIENLRSDSHNASKSPTREGQQTLKMLNDFLRGNGYSSLLDAYRKMTKKSDELNDRNRRWKNIDTMNTRTIRILEFNRNKYVINNEEDTDFWTIFGMRNKSSRYNFIDNVIYSLEHGYWGSEYESAIRNGDLGMFKKYLQNLAHKKVALGTIYSIFERLGVNPKDAIEETVGSYKVYEIEGNYWDISYKYLLPPFRYKDEDEVEEYKKQLFKKTATE